MDESFFYGRNYKGVLLRRTKRVFKEVSDSNRDGERPKDR